MKNRREFLLTLTAGLVALVVVITPVIAEELLGVITKVNVEGKKLTVEEKESGKEIEVTVTDDTEYVTGKGAGKVDIEKLSKNIEKAKDAGKKGVMAKITHEKGVASKIVAAAKKKAAN
jgi:biopolymer transport protein ExbD